jgi:hypothetical protein
LTNINNVGVDTSDLREGLGSALFGGSNYFEIAQNGIFSPENFTITCWTKIVLSSSYGTIASCRDLSPFRGWMIYTYSGSIEFVSGNSNSWASSGALPNFVQSTPVWRHLAITYRLSTREVRFYFDGVFIGVYDVPSVRNLGRSLRIGAGANEGAAQYFLPGGSRLDDFRFFNRVLDASEISSIYFRLEPGPICQDCPIGTYTSTSCAGCAAGKYNRSFSTSCISCPAGNFNPGTAASACSTCALGYTSSSGASACVACIGDKYGITNVSGGYCIDVS